MRTSVGIICTNGHNSFDRCQIGDDAPVHRGAAECGIDDGRLQLDHRLLSALPEALPSRRSTRQRDHERHGRPTPARHDARSGQIHVGDTSVGRRLSSGSMELSVLPEPARRRAAAPRPGHLFQGQSARALHQRSNASRVDGGQLDPRPEDIHGPDGTAERTGQRNDGTGQPGDCACEPAAAGVRPATHAAGERATGIGAASHTAGDHACARTVPASHTAGDGTAPGTALANDIAGERATTGADAANHTARERATPGADADSHTARERATPGADADSHTARERATPGTGPASNAAGIQSVVLKRAFWDSPNRSEVPREGLERKDETGNRRKQRPDGPNVDRGGTGCR
jgi:hypothetical protein